MSVPARELGLGLISIGRAWGVRPAPLPSEREAQALLEDAVSGGIRFFDTAPSYGESECRLGVFLRTVNPAGLTIATKCGEHWDAAQGAPYVDHGYDALRRSIDNSLARLGRVDLLQIHKSTAAVLASGAVRRALEYARACGVREFGASVTDLDTARAALAEGAFGWLQFFYNRNSPQLEPVFALAAGVRVIVNRPFAMGALMYGEHEERGDEAAVEAFRFVLQPRYAGVVLTGTRSPEHLRRNLDAFRRASGV